MTLTNRLLLAFLSTLVAVLIGFCASLYGLADRYLLQQAANQLEHSLNTLQASIEVKSDRVEYEPEERLLIIGTESARSQIFWIIQEDNGETIGGSLPSGFPMGGRFRSDTNPQLVNFEGETWFVASRWIRPTNTIAKRDPSLLPKFGSREYPCLRVVTALSLAPTYRTLQMLAFTLIALSAMILLIFGFIARWLCRHVLGPVQQMVRAAHNIDSDRWDERLPESASRDEIQELSRSFNALLNRLQTSFERQRQFTSSASHQLRTPLTVVRGQLEVALLQQRTAAEYTSVLATTLKRSIEMQRIVESLLFLARADGESGLPDLEPINLADWLTEYVKTWSDHERSNDLVLQLNNSESIEIVSHPVLLGELLNVIVDNAIRYSDPETSIAITLSSVSGTATIQIQDRGIGIDREHIDEIFLPFFRSGNGSQRHRSGIGLGLTIAKRLSDSLRIIIDVESVPNEGSTFAIIFPVACPLG